MYMYIHTRAPVWLGGKESACKAGVQPLGWEDPLEKGMEPTPVFLPAESHGQRSLAGCIPQGHRELGTT